MKTLNCVKILLLCIFAVGLLSCGDDVYYTMENSDKKLCDRTWIDEYETDEGLTCTYQLRFFKDIIKGRNLQPPMIPVEKRLSTENFPGVGQMIARKL